jgi:hypothetical protein
MTKEELWETIRELEKALTRVDGNYKMLRHRPPPHWHPERCSRCLDIRNQTFIASSAQDMIVLVVASNTTARRTLQYGASYLRK